MAFLVDTNVIIDVLTDDPQWAEWSISKLEACSEDGLVINPVVYAELCFGCPSAEFVDDLVRRFSLSFQEIPRRGLFIAAKAFERYKARDGNKTTVLPDFFIGGHAEAAAMPVLTRDTRRLRTYFPSVSVIGPDQG